MSATKSDDKEYVILVNTEDEPIGQAEKITAHRNNQLHRAFSVFLLRKAPTFSILLQQRALDKYHCGGLWTNTCCSHPRLGEDIITAGNRRLWEELGIHATLENIGWFHYNAHFNNGLSENENDHVLIAFAPDDLTFTINPEEVHATRWISIADLEKELDANPEHFTPWLKQALAMVKKHCLVEESC